MLHAASSNEQNLFLFPVFKLEFLSLQFKFLSDEISSYQERFWLYVPWVCSKVASCWPASHGSSSCSAGLGAAGHSGVSSFREAPAGGATQLVALLLVLSPFLDVWLSRFTLVSNLEVLFPPFHHPCFHVEVQVDVTLPHWTQSVKTADPPLPILSGSHWCSEQQGLKCCFRWWRHFFPPQNHKQN